MSHELALPTSTQENWHRFPKPLGAIAALALAAGLSGCGAQE